MIGLAVAALALAAWWFWSSREQAFDASSFVAGFERRNELTVFAAQVVPVVTTVEPGLIRALDRRHTAIIPAEVRYTVDMRAIDEGDVRWDPERALMTLTAPPVKVAAPNLREERGQYYSSGLPQFGQAAAASHRRSSGKAAAEAARLARSPELIRLAQDGARAAIADNAAAILRGAGFENARVEVRFETEGATRNGEQLDRSRSLQEVYGGAAK